MADERTFVGVEGSIKKRDKKKRKREIKER
jgi:hypothetical protein